jgi:hypothetical protein
METKRGVGLRLMAYATVVASVLAGTAVAIVRGQGQIPVINADDGLFYSRGQNVVPVFEGWVPNPDGTFSLVFGSFNRNWEEEMFIPVGPNNHIDPGGPDRGQPTAFAPRRGKNLFEIIVPKDFGDKEVVWTIVSRGKTEKAYGTLTKPEVLTRRMVEAGGALSENAAAGNDNVGDQHDPNKAPAVKTEAASTALLSAPAVISATVTDDGLPAAGGRGRRAGLHVEWSLFRGPGHVSFEPRTSPVSSPTGGKVTTNAKFTVAGDYVLRASAIDGGGLGTNSDVKVSVK